MNKPTDDPSPVDPRFRGFGTSPTLAIDEKSARLEREGRRVDRLGLGQSPFPVHTPVVDALRDHAAEKDYLPVRGLRELREAVADHHGRTRGREAEADDVIVGPGSKELIYLLQTVVDGEVWAPNPSWVSYQPQSHIADKSFRWLPTSRTSGWRLTPEILDRVAGDAPAGTHLLILNYPNNPTGTTYGDDQLEALAEVARDHGIVVLSDEIYFAVDHDGGHASIAAHYPEGTVVSGGLSKWCGAGGWRLGTMTFCPELRPLADALAAVASETFTAVSAPIQYAAISAFEESEAMAEYLEAQRRILAPLGAEVTRRLREAGAAMPDAEGAFYVFPDFGPVADTLSERGVTTSPELADTVLEETGVAFLPGTAFGRPADELTVRLAYVNFDGDAALEAVLGGREVDAAFLEEFCGETLGAVERLCGWIEGGVIDGGR